MREGGRKGEEGKEGRRAYITVGENDPLPGKPPPGSTVRVSERDEREKERDRTG